MDNLVYEIEKIVRECGIFLLNSKNIVIDKKEGRGNIVTNYDKEVQFKLKDKLIKLVNNANFICEEEDFHDKINSGGYTFIIDPIDGTYNFSRNFGLSAISVALLKDGTSFISVCYNPYKDEMFLSQVGKGSYLNGKRISVSDNKLNDGIVMAGNAPYNRNLQGRTLEILSKLLEVANDYRRIGSAVIELCDIACGRAELYYELEIRIWDYAAAYLIIKEAGGIVTDINGNDIKFDKICSIIASNGKDNYLEYMM